MPEITRDVALGQYGAIDWPSFGRVGILSAADVAALKAAEDAPLDYSLGDVSAARAYVAALLAVVGRCGDVAARQYALTRVEDVLLAEDCGSLADRVAHFVCDGALDAAPFLRALERADDAYCARVAASSLATLLTVVEDADGDAFVAWLCEQLASSRGERSHVRAAVPALTILLRVARARTAFAAHGGVGYVTKLLKKPGHDSANAQLLYELTFCLWALSFGGGDVAADFLQCGSVAVLCDQVSAAPREKVVRVSLATLRNLADAAAGGEPGDGDAGGAAAAMIKCGLVKTLKLLKDKKWADPDVADDVDALHKKLLANYRELTTLERYAAEVRSGDLAWGLVHTDKFWRENARAAEADDFALIKLLVQLLDGDRDPTVVSIACYDVGEFVRFYPNGKAVVKHLGAKDKIMALIDHEDPEIQRHALQCVSKILVTNWEFCN